MRRYGRTPAKYVKRRQLLLTQRQQQRLRAQRREQLQQRKQQQQQQEAAQQTTATTVATVATGTSDNNNCCEQATTTLGLPSGCSPSASPKRVRPRKQAIAALHLLESLDTTLTRGYFSDPELNSSSSGNSCRGQATVGLYAPTTPSPLLASTQQQPPNVAEKRSKSETKKPLTAAVAFTSLATQSTSAGIEPPAKKPRKQPVKIKVKVKTKVRSTTAKGRKAAAATVAASTSAPITTTTLVDAETNNNEYQTADLQAQKCNATPTVPVADATQQTTTATASVDVATATAAAAATTTQPQQHSDEQHKFLVPSTPLESVLTTTPTPTPTPTSTTTTPAAPVRHAHTTTHTKRARSRCKFGNRKKQRQRPGGVSFELDETQPPATRANVVPKWNNGWMWAGKAFQGAVFLNSDDPLVLRTCYPAMRHVEGDIIRARDCVLLKANEDNELPYVAKVAHLWQNPEDGEMMMSLLWYYRPEHTDQGRQRNDCPDEVYASRHRDHNSVACIEDKCYVLTFSEYCRYRRRLRAAEEDVEDVSIVPRRSNTANCFTVRTVPDHTNPELVMFCRRAYEFRTRRLLKLPQKNALVCS